MAGHHGALARLGFRERNIETLGKGLQCLVGGGVFDPAAANDQRLALAAKRSQRVTDHGAGGRASVDAVHAFLQEIVGVVPGFGLYILGQGQGHRAGFSRVGQHAHGVDSRGHQLLGAVDAVPVFAHGTEGVVGADAQVVELLDLLQHRVGLTAGIDIAGQQQQRDAVGGGSRCGGEHIGRARPDRGRARIDLAAQVLLGEPDGGVGHALLIAALMHHQVAAVLLQGLAKAQHIAMPENSEDPGDKLALYAVDFDVLVVQELHQGLGHGQSCCGHHLHLV